MHAVFIDLDNTIMDNKTIKQNAMTSTLRYLDLKKPVKKLLSRYEETVEQGYVFELLGYDNFIHILNSIDLHAILTVLYSDNKIDLKRLKISQDDQQAFIRKIDEVRIKFYDSQLNRPPIDEDLYKNFCKKVLLDPVIQKL